MAILIFGGCGIVSGLDEYEVSAGTSGGGQGGSSGGDGFVKIGGSVSGLMGTGLVLRNNGADDIQIGMNGPFTFPAKVQSGGAYSVTIAAQPSSPSQGCIVSNGAGTATGDAISDIAVNCSTSTYGIGGTVVGFSGSGLVLTNAGDDLTISKNGAFQFKTKVASGSAFDIAVKTQPSVGGPCTVSGGKGIVGNADVGSVLVNCASGMYTVGGTVSGLVGTVVLKLNGGTTLDVTADGTFAFAQTLAPGAAYGVAVATPPSYPPRSQQCTVTGGNGTMGNANVTNVKVTCTTRTYIIGGGVSNSSGPIVLQNNGSEQITVNVPGVFAFPTGVASGNTYSVTVLTPPSGQTCSVTNATGTVTNGNVSSVSVECSSANQGILCNGDYCGLGTEECCFANNAYSCVGKCMGLGAVPIRCDSPADCAPGFVCCGTLLLGSLTNVSCVDAAQCAAPKLTYCNPDDANPCPSGGTCTATTTPPGYYRCN